MEDLQAGLFDVLVGVNLLREGLDLPEVSLVAILDADKEGFLRSARSLTQTAGRAARNLNGLVIMYADKITDAMQTTITETNRRREKQARYNAEHGITPRQVYKSSKGSLSSDLLSKPAEEKAYVEPEILNVAADPVLSYMSKNDIQKSIQLAKDSMEKAAKELNFIEAAKYRDEMFALIELSNKKG
jgi:excinuclease ABC subunit B